MSTLKQFAAWSCNKSLSCLKLVIVCLLERATSLRNDPREGPLNWRQAHARNAQAMEGGNEESVSPCRLLSTLVLVDTLSVSERSEDVCGVLRQTLQFGSCTPSVHPDPAVTTGHNSWLLFMMYNHDHLSIFIISSKFKSLLFKSNQLCTLNAWFGNREGTITVIRLGWLPHGWVSQKAMPGLDFYDRHEARDAQNTANCWMAFCMFLENPQPHGSKQLINLLVTKVRLQLPNCTLGGVNEINTENEYK